MEVGRVVKVEVGRVVGVEVVWVEVVRVEHLSSYGVMVRPSSLWLGVNTRCPEDSSCCRA